MQCYIGPQNKTESVILFAIYAIVAVAVMIAIALCFILIGVLSVHKSSKKKGMTLCNNSA